MFCLGILELEYIDVDKYLPEWKCISYNDLDVHVLFFARNQKLSDFRFPILNAKSLFSTFVRLLWDNCLAHIENLVCVMKYLAFLFLWFWFVKIELVLYFFLKSTIHSRQTTLVWHGLYFLFDIGLFHATSVVVLRIYRRPRSGNWPMKIPHFGGVFRIK